MVKRRRKVNERVNPFKKLQKPGKHVKRIVVGAAGLVIIAGLAGDATYQIQEQEQAVLTTSECRRQWQKQDCILRFLLYRKYRK